jgi:GH24 family phage-related lysozyme (muramidase)
MWSKSKLRDFFKNYDEFNPNHNEGVDKLQAAAEALMNDDADWVKKFRSKLQAVPSGDALKVATKIIGYFEGFRAKPYLCPAGVWTIGYGSTFYPNGQAVQDSDPAITEEQAEEYMIAVLNRAFIPHLQKIPTWKQMNAYQQATVMSFAYNLGAHFYGDTANFNSITKALSSQANWHDVPRALSLYVNPGSAFEVGLRKRRKAEGDLWNGTGEFAQ